MEKKMEHFSLKWSNFRSNLTEAFHDFLLEEMMVDVTLAAEGKFVQAHKLILSVCSPYFKNLFKVNPCKHPIVILKDVGLNELSHMLQFMYKGEVGVKPEELQSFMKLAETLKIRGLIGEEFEIKKNTIARVKKKKKKIFDVDKENTDFESHKSKTKEKNDTKGRKRRLSMKSGTARKVKKRDESRVKQLNSLPCVSESGNEDNNPLVNVISDKVKNDDSVKVSEFQCDDKSGVSDTGVGNTDGDKDDDDDVSDLRDEFNVSPSFRNPEYSSEVDQTPQVLSKKCWRQSPIWNFFLVQKSFVICKTCGKTLKGVKSTNAESHLACIHSDLFPKFILARKKWRRERGRAAQKLFFPKICMD